MHIHTPLNKNSIRTHLTYTGWKYVLLVVCAIFGWSLFFTVTRDTVPDDKRIDLYIVGRTGQKEAADAFIQPIAAEVTPEMESVSSVVIYPDSNYGNAQLIGPIMVGEGDIYILDETFFKSFASNGTFLPLDELVADGTIQVSDVDLSKGYVTAIESYDDDQRPIIGESRLYGIPLDTFYGYMEGMLMDNRGMYAVIAVNNRNDANVIPFFNAFLQAGRGEMPAELKDALVNK